MGDFYIRKLMNHADSVKYLLYFVSFHSLRFGEFVVKFSFGNVFCLFVAGYYRVGLNTEISIVCRNMK